MKKEIVKNVTRFYLEPGDEVLISDVKIRNEAIYVGGKTFQLPESTGKFVSVTVYKENGKLDYDFMDCDNNLNTLDVEFDSKGPFVEIPLEYEFIDRKKEMFYLKKVSTDIHIQAVYTILGHMKREGIVMQAGVLKKIDRERKMEQIEYDDMQEETQYLIELNIPVKIIEKGILEIYDYLIGQLPSQFQKTYSVLSIES